MFVVIYNLKNWRKDLIMSVALEQKQGLIAGDGLLPVKMAQYAKENGFRVEVQGGFYEANNMRLRRFKITKEDV